MRATITQLRPLLGVSIKVTHPFIFEGGGGAFLFFLADAGRTAAAACGGGGGMTLLWSWSPNTEGLLTMGLRDLSSSPRDPLLTLLSPAL